MIAFKEGDRVDGPEPEDLYGEVIACKYMGTESRWLQPSAKGTKIVQVLPGLYYCVRWSSKPLRWNWYSAEQLITAIRRDD